MNSEAKSLLTQCFDKLLMGEQNSGANAPLTRKQTQLIEDFLLRLNKIEAKVDMLVPLVETTKLQNEMIAHSILAVLKR